MSDVLITAPPGGDYDKAPALRVIVWVEATVGTAVLLLRLFTRTKIVNNLGWDDFWMVVTWVDSLSPTSLNNRSITNTR